MKSSEELICYLANMFDEKSVKAEVIESALKAICQRFDCDSGLVYEIDQTNEFKLKESYNCGKLSKFEKLHINSLSPEYRKEISEKTIVYIEEGDCNYDEKLLLGIWNTQRAIISTLVDDNERNSGLLAFLSPGSMSEDEKKLFSILMSMLGRYVGIRIYRNKLSHAQVALGRILDNTGIDIYVNDFYNHDILYVNQSMAKPYGGVQAFMNNKCWEVLFPEQGGPCEFCPEQYLIDEDGNPTKIYTWDYQRSMDGSWFRVFSTAFRWVDGRLAHLVSSADITDNKKNEELISYLANYDPLTNLPNRRKLVADCELRIDQTKKEDVGYVMFFDIDGFKAINDMLGHDAGDEFLVQLGEFFNNIPLLKGGIYRNGGDEFVAIIDGRVDPKIIGKPDARVTKDTIRELAKTIHDRFEKLWKLKSGEVYCNTSIGTACYPEDGLAAEDLLLKADQAMYKAKKMGGAMICFANEMKSEQQTSKRDN